MTHNTVGANPQKPTNSGRTHKLKSERDSTEWHKKCIRTDIKFYYYYLV